SRRYHHSSPRRRSLPSTVVRPPASRRIRACAESRERSARSKGHPESGRPNRPLVTSMFTKTAEFYDAIYSWKNYERESKLLIDLIGRHKRSTGNSLLDVACGTGAHIAHLKGLFAIEGLDLDDQMLAIARAKHPEIRFHRADMIDFDLGREFDVVVCLFSAI